MKFSFVPSLKILIPLLLIIFAVILSAGYLYYTLPRAEEVIEKRYTQALYRNLSRIQGNSEYLLRKDDFPGVQREVASFASDPENMLVLIADEQQRIVATTKRALLNKSLTAAFPEINTKVAQQAIENQRAEIITATGGGILTGYTSVNFGANANELRPNRIGLLIFQKDMAVAKAEARAQILNQSLYWSSLVIFLALALGVIFHCLLTRRVGRLLLAAEAIAKGDLSVRSQLSGSDELARLSRAFDEMARNISESQDKLTADITQRKQVAANLRESEASYRALFDASEEAIFIHDVNTGAFLDVNYKACETFGYTREEMLTLTVNDISSGAEPYTQEQANQILAKVEKGTPLRFNWRNKKRDGSLYWSEVCVKLTTIAGQERILAFVQDISERKTAEDALRASEVQYRSIFDATTDGLLVWRLDGTTVDMNPALCKMWGYSKEDLMTISWKKLIHTGSQQQFREFKKAWIRSEDFQGEAQTMRKDGSRLDIELHVVSIAYQGEPHRLSVIRDITRRRQNELERLQLESQLRQAQKMEAIGQLTGGIAHDFNNILTSIVGNADLGLELFSETDNPKLEKYFNNILRSGGRARDLIRQMLTFSRGQHGETCILPLAPVIDDTIKMMRSTLPSSMELRTNISSAVPLVRSDPVQIEQIVMNLYINARDAMEGQGAVTISLYNQSHEHTICSSCRRTFSGEFVELTVKDNGDGIDLDTLDRIFEPFFTTKEVGKGSGMGLSMVHGIVHEHGGHITVRTARGKGSTFRILFPAGRSVQGKHNFVNGRAITNTSTKGNINASVLLVDDEQMVLEFMTDLLQSRGMNVMPMANGEHALSTFSKDPDAYDMVITDQTMPKITGTELAELLLRQRPNLPIILYTGHSEKLTEAYVRQLGIKGFQKKPVDINALMTMIKNLLDEVNIEKKA